TDALLYAIMLFAACMGLCLNMSGFAVRVPRIPCVCKNTLHWKVHTLHSAAKQSSYFAQCSEAKFILCTVQRSKVHTLRSAARKVLYSESYKESEVLFV